MSDDVMEQVAATIAPVDENGCPRYDRLPRATLRAIAGCPGPPPPAGEAPDARPVG